MHWLEILHGQRSPDLLHFESEKQQRISETKSIMKHIFGKLYAESLKLLASDKETIKSLSQLPEVQKACQAKTQPSLYSLLGLKNQLKIPDLD